MKKYSLIFCIVVSLFLVSCHTRSEFDYLHPTDEIAAVYIVNLQLLDDGELLQTERASITDVDFFISEFSQLECYVYYGDPVAPVSSEKMVDAIKILYSNGDYELIAYNGKSEYTENKGFNLYAGYRIFNEDEFKNLISSYLDG